MHITSVSAGDGMTGSEKTEFNIVKKKRGLYFSEFAETHDEFWVLGQMEDVLLCVFSEDLTFNKYLGDWEERMTWK